MKAPTSTSTLVTLFWMFSVSTVAAASGFWGLDALHLLTPCSTIETGPPRPLEFATPVVHPENRGIRVSRLDNLASFRSTVRSASTPQTIRTPEGEQLLNALVAGFQERVDAIDGCLQEDLGLGLDVVFDVLQTQLQIAIFGADELPSRRPTEDPGDWAFTLVDAAVVFAIDAHGQMLQAKGAFHELIQRARLAPESTVTEIEMEGHPVCAIEQGGNQLLLTWLGPLLVGAVGPEALSAAILSFETSTLRKSGEDFI